VFSRYSDFISGVGVSDERTEKKIEGKLSKIAGRKVFMQMALSRFIMPTFCVVGPTASFYFLSSLNLLPKGAVGKHLSSLIICGIFLELGLTLALGAFP